MSVWYRTPWGRVVVTAAKHCRESLRAGQHAGARWRLTIPLPQFDLKDRTASDKMIGEKVSSPLGGLVDDLQRYRG